MKKFLIPGLVIAAIYFGWQYAPESLKGKIHAAADYVGLTRIVEQTITRPFSSLKDKIAPDDPSLSRALLIDQLAEKLDTIAENKSPKTAAQKATLESALKDSRELVSQLREKNKKAGLADRTFERITDAIIPGQPAATTSCVSANSN